MTPQHRHDCALCTFLGSLGPEDLYHCPQHGIPALVVRRGSARTDFVAVSTRESDGTAPAVFREAFRRAAARGLPLG